MHGARPHSDLYGTVDIRMPSGTLSVSVFPFPARKRESVDSVHLADALLMG